MKIQSKWLLLLLSATVLTIYCSACALDSRYPSSISIQNPKALFTAKTSDMTPESTTAFSYLFQLSEDGTIQRVFFIDQNGNEIDCFVYDLFYLSENYVGIQFCGGGLDRRAIADLSTGTLLDLSSYFGLHNAQLIGNTLIVHDTDKTLYRIDLSARTAIAVNNPDYTPIFDTLGWRTTYSAAPGINRASSFVSDKELNLMANTSDGPYIFYANNDPPYDANGETIGSSRSSIFNGPDGSLYVIGRQQPTLVNTFYLSKCTFSDSGVLTEVSVIPNPNDGDYFIYHRNTYSFQTYERFIPTRDGYIKTYADASDNVICEYIAKVMPTFPFYNGEDPYEYPLISGEYIYWKTGDTIKRIQFSPSSNEETVATTSNLIYYEVVNGIVFFTRYITGTQINTYKVVSPGAELILVNSSDMEIKYIVEF